MANFSLIHAVVPASTGNAPHPGLLLLHGRGTDENDLLPLGPEIDPRLYTISARAPFQFPWGGYAWYDLDRRGVGYPDERTLAESIALIVRFIDEIVEAYPIDRERLFVGGFSMGAATSVGLALTNPNQVAGAIVLSGYVPIHTKLPFDWTGANGLPVFEAHGAMDPVIPIVWARASRDFLADRPVDLTYREYPMAHEISATELRDVSRWMGNLLDTAG